MRDDLRLERERPPRLSLDGLGPLFRQIERVVTDLILKQEYRVGERLPTETELMRIFKTSRQTVNKALSELAKHGLIERNRRAGTIVSWRFQERFTIALLDVSDEVTGGGHVYAFRILARRIVHNGQGGMHWASLPQGARVLFLECLHSADGLPVQLETRYINLEAVPWIKDEAFAEMSPSKWLLANVPWSEAIHTVRGTNANEELAGKLGLAVGAACLVIDRQTFHLGQPVTLVHMTHPGDRFAVHGTENLNRAHRA